MYRCVIVMSVHFLPVHKWTLGHIMNQVLPLFELTCMWFWYQIRSLFAHNKVSEITILVQLPLDFWPCYTNGGYWATPYISIDSVINVFSCFPALTLNSYVCCWTLKAQLSVSCSNFIRKWKGNLLFRYENMQLYDTAEKWTAETDHMARTVEQKSPSFYSLVVKWRTIQDCCAWISY